jgi:acyl-CoA synthetase (NDP forming)
MEAKQMNGPIPMHAENPARSLKALLAPRSVAIIGASEKSRWSNVTFGNLTKLDFTGEVHLVNRRGEATYGRKTARNCVELGAEVDVGIVMVPMAAVYDAVADLAAAKVRSAVVLTSGFAELGPDGAAEQRRLVELARQSGVSLVGPNSLGYINYVDHVPLWTAPCARNPILGSIAVASHSGQVAYHLNTYAQHQGVGLSHLVTTGNEADIDIADFTDHFVDDANVRSIALYLETVRRPARFIDVVRRARDAAKPVVVFKIGVSDVAARSARAHTGALVGDDNVFSGICAQYGVVRVHSIEDLFCTADVMGRAGVLRAGGLGFVSNSGGICTIAADTASAAGIDVPLLSAPTIDGLRQVLPSYATTQNPLDITGAAAIDRSLFAKTLELMAEEPKLAAIVAFTDLPSSREETDESLLAGLRYIGEGIAISPIPSFVLNCFGRPVTDSGRAIIDEFRLPFVAAGLQRGIDALGRAIWWSNHCRRAHTQAAIRQAIASPRELNTEDTALAFLASCGVPTVPMQLVKDEETAIAAASDFGGPVAVKICSRHIAQKSDIGGVALNVEGGAAVAKAFAAVQARVPDGAEVRGVLVAPMRAGGIELFVGVTRDPDWGPVIAVGLGGIWVEVLRDVAIRRLPVSADDARDMLGELKGAALFEGKRGEPKADMAAVARTIAVIGDAALSLGPSLEILEINPLWVRGDRIEALDALVVADDAVMQSKEVVT